MRNFFFFFISVHYLTEEQDLLLNIISCVLVFLRRLNCTLGNVDGNNNNENLAIFGEFLEKFKNAQILG